MKSSAAIYLRSSKDRSDVSIDAQRRALHEMAVARGLAVVEEYADAVESGKDDDRPGFQRLIYDLKRPGRPWSLILAMDTARIARRRHLAIIVERDCKKRGVKIIYRNIPDSDPITEMLLLSVLQAMDEWHSLTSRAKGLAGMAENVRQGWRAGGRAPRGYEIEQHQTGAVRDGQLVLKSKLVPNDDAQIVADYLRHRAAGAPRSVAASRSGIRWPVTSLHSMDWQALTYAGHTIWNIHNEREGGKAVNGEKRRPRSEWVINRDTHPALITTEEAEQILAEMERGQAGRRTRASPLLLSGLVRAPDGQGWASDGCGMYRLGKGAKISAKRLEAAVLDGIESDLMSDASINHVRRALADLEEAPVSPQQISGLERRIGSLAAQITRTIDLASKTEHPEPVLRRVTEIEQDRVRLAEELDQLRLRQARRNVSTLVTAAEVRDLLSRLFAGIHDAENVSEARAAIADMVDRVELEPVTMTGVIHYSMNPGGFERGIDVHSYGTPSYPPLRWTGDPIHLKRKSG